MTLTEKTVRYNNDKTWEVEELDNDVRHLMEWMKKQPHLKNPTDEREVKYFYCIADGNLQIAKRAIDDTYTNISNYFKMYSHWDNIEERINRCFDNAACVLLPERLPTGHHVFLFSLLDMNPANYCHEDQFMVVLLLNECLKLRYSEPSKSMSIIDFKGFTFQHVLGNNFLRLKQLTICGKGMTEYNTKSFHCINMPLKSSLLFGWTQSAVNKSKIEIHFHTNEENLLEHFPKTVIPKQFGGLGPDLLKLNEVCRKEAISMLDVLHRKREQLWYVDESKRPESNKSQGNSMFGMDGSFKKLQID